MMENSTPPEEVETPLERGLGPEKDGPDEDDGQGASLAQTKSLEERVSLPREILVVGLVSLAQFTTQIALGNVLVITHAIGDHFNITDPGILSWLIAGYSLTVGTFILVSGRLGDLFGWKRMLVIGYSWTALWSVVLGLSWYSNHVLFVFARVFQGIGPSICMPNGLALLGAIYTPGKRKNMAFAVFGGCAPGGAITGYVFAGIFTQFAWWPWTYWSFGIALVAIAAVAAIAVSTNRCKHPLRVFTDLIVHRSQTPKISSLDSPESLSLTNFRTLIFSVEERVSLRSFYSIFPGTKPRSSGGAHPTLSLL